MPIWTRMLIDRLEVKSTLRANISTHVPRWLLLAEWMIGLSLFLAAQPGYGQQVHQLSLENAIWTDRNLFGAKAEPSAGGAAFLTTPNDQRHVYYLAPDNTPDVHQLFYNGTSWSDQDLTILTGGPGATPNSAITGFSVGNLQYVYYIGMEEHVHQLLYNNVGWVDTDLSAQTAGPLASARALIAFTTTPALHVYYLDSTYHHVHQIFTTNGVNWQDQDLTILTGGTVGKANTGWMSGFNIDNFQYVYFVADNGHVHQFLYNNSSWSDQDLTTLTKTAPAVAASGVEALVIPGTKKLRVYFSTADGHILQLASSNNTNWSHADLTKKSNAPLATGTTRILAITTTPSNQVHLFYVSYVLGNYNQNHLFHLTQATATTWLYTDVTTLTNGGIPERRGDLAGFSLENNPYIIYVASAAPTNQWSTPTIDGYIAPGEYGNDNSLTDAGNTGQTWYMTWDANNLYVGIVNANLSTGAVLYVADNPRNPPTCCSDADGNLVGFNYDGTDFSSLPFRAKFVTYVKDGYREYRRSDGQGGWTSAISDYGTYASSSDNQNTREVAIPWNAISSGAIPRSFVFFGYLTSGGGYVYGQVPTDNNIGGVIGTSATATQYYAVGKTGNGMSTPPFSDER